MEKSENLNGLYSGEFVLLFFFYFIHCFSVELKKTAIVCNYALEWTIIITERNLSF